MNLTMRNAKEIYGLRTEIIGLALILVAAIWQFGFTDWFDRAYLEAEHYIQERVNITLLGNQEKFALAWRTESKERQQEILREIGDGAGKAIFAAVRERDERAHLQKGQGSIFKGIRAALFVVGSVLILLSKFLVMWHKRDQLVPASAPAGSVDQKPPSELPPEPAKTAAPPPPSEPRPPV